MKPSLQVKIKTKLKLMLPILLLTRALETTQYLLAESDQEWIPVHKSWRLNERHYGKLQG